MTEAEAILKIIETVDPADTAKLDEIDARVQKFLINDPRYVLKDVAGQWIIHEPGKFNFKNKATIYTRSRDALKAIRPEGWAFYINSRGVCQAYSSDNVIRVLPLPTEELAELHAIIQAIEYERRSVATNP
jgi:hypothetical protein